MDDRARESPTKALPRHARRKSSTMDRIAALIENGNTPRTLTYAEAPCSMNTHVEVPGFGRVQVTGRGVTPAEAVANLRGQVEALTSTPAPVLSREERLAQLLTCGLTKAVAKQDWCLTEKLGKAAVLVLSGAVQPGEREGLTTVRSLTNPDTWYEVDELGQCSCPDYHHRAKEGERFWCKHTLAAMMAQRLNS